VQWLQIRAIDGGVTVTRTRARLACPAVRKILAMMAVAVVLGACGGGDDDDETGQEAVSSDGGGDSDSDEYTEALAAGMEGDEDLPAFDETQRTCFARGIVDAIGADTLKDAGVTPEEFVAADDLADLDIEIPADAADSLGQSIADCDIAEVIEQDLVLGSFSDDFGFDLPPDGGACLSEQMDDRALADAVAEAFLGEGAEDSMTTVIVDAIVACPSVAAAAFISQAPAPLSPEGEQCVTDFVAANPEVVRAVLASGGEDQAAVEQFGTQLATTCPEFAGG
jgi:hypothetical protein